jgi:hypothetical protein
MSTIPPLTQEIDAEVVDAAAAQAARRGRQLSELKKTSKSVVPQDHAAEDAVCGATF